MISESTDMLQYLKLVMAGLAPLLAWSLWKASEEKQYLQRKHFLKFCNFIFASTTDKILVTCPGKQFLVYVILLLHPVLVGKQEKAFLVSYNRRKPSIIHG